MAKFTYTLKIGDYDSEDAFVDIDLRIGHDGLEPVDYETVREALKTVEDIARKYQLQMVKPKVVKGGR